MASLTSVFQLSRCDGCNLPFSNHLILESTLSPVIVTRCFHAYHQSCLKEWVSIAEKSCPSCKTVCYQHQAGKRMSVIWKIFLKTLQIAPSTVCEVLQSIDPTEEDSCAICLEDFPVIPVVFDRERNRLFHQDCSPSTDSIALTPNKISSVIRKYANQDSQLAALFKPSPPSFYQRFRRDHEDLFETTQKVIDTLTQSASSGFNLAKALFLRPFTQRD